MSISKSKICAFGRSREQRMGSTKADETGTALDRRGFLGAQVSLLALSGLSVGVADAADGQGARLARLAVEVERAEDVRAIKRLKRAYSQYLELGLWRDLIELFTEDAVGDYPAGVFIGKKNLWPHFLDNNGRGILGVENGRLMPHISFQPVITLAPDGKSALGRWKVFAMLGATSGLASWNGMLYEDKYVKEDGVWKIAELRTHSEFGGAYAGGWTQVRTPPPRAPGAPAPASLFSRLPHPPARPHGEPCEGYLTKCVFPYHYQPATVGLLDTAGAGGGAGGSVDVGGLMQRITRLNDQAEIESLQDAYGLLIDRKQWDQAAALFADDATYEFAQQGVYVGPARIRKALELNGPQGLKPGEVNDHVNFGALVTVSADGRTAKARGDELILTGSGDGKGRVMQGLYENTYVKRGGAWKIQSVHFYPRMVADAALGWGKDAQPAPGPSAALPPDRPPSEVYEIYPKGYFPPLHFVNPVTGKPTQYPEGAPAAKMADAVAAFADAKPPAPKALSPAQVRAALPPAEVQMRRAAAYDAVENLTSAYGYYMDEYDWDGLTGLLTANAALSLDWQGVATGREKARGFLRAKFGADGMPEGQLLNHLVMQPVIQVAADGRSARVRARLFEMSGRSGGEGRWGAGLYEDEAVLDAGAWKLKSVRLTRTWSASYADGWARPTMATNTRKR